ncbi:MAG: prepilin-type N-terminal cleavage/methylation domain-containing protein [Candidatus Omnitrophota bacterium]|nr:prepilin-type N-terminal cleavage/methylation domain-containing protein [Candidatus Omnitrophota bacterium]MDZ4241275.1 prepilin-type N-terminal cleavage/methylation domain-containing protein [Candidatus Omnitrophota bacterium]
MGKPMKRQSGFTLLELIVVILIVGVLSAIAFPRFFRTVERSRGTEAIINLSAIRQAMERYYLQNNGQYGGVSPFNFQKIGIDNPALSPNSHFTYMIFASVDRYVLVAQRNTRDNIYDISGSVSGSCQGRTTRGLPALCCVRTTRRS